MNDLQIRVTNKKAYKLIENLHELNIIKIVSKPTSKISKFKEEHKKSIIKSFQEVKDIESGKIEKPSLKDFIDELRKI